MTKIKNKKKDPTLGYTPSLFDFATPNHQPKKVEPSSLETPTTEPKQCDEFEPLTRADILNEAKQSNETEPSKHDGHKTEPRKPKYRSTLSCTKCGSKKIKRTSGHIIIKDEKELVAVKCLECKAKTKMPLNLWENSVQSRMDL